MTYAEIEIGQSYEKKRKITAEMVELFAKITEDNNPLHLDEEFAKKSIFGRRIAHGMLVAGQVSAVFGMDFPGPGTIYMKQENIFYKPIFVDEEVLVKVVVKEKIDAKKRIVFDTYVLNEKGEKAIAGEAMMKFDR